MTIQSVVSEAVYIFAQVLKALLFARVLLTWFPRLRAAGGFVGKLIGVIFALTEPILGPLRRMLHRSPVSGIGTVLDFSPILSYFLIDSVALLIIYFLAG